MSKKSNPPFNGDTICAVSTPRGCGGVGIVRISGANAMGVIKNFVTPSALPPRVAEVVKIIIGGFTDTAIGIYFKSPHSFTGEDVVELQCHGGEILLNKVIDKLIANGARLAERGEFTRRAILNGKMTLAGAESLVNIIDAESDNELLVSGNLSSGKLNDDMREIERQLVDLSAQIEGAIDHPEDIQIDTAAIKSQIAGFLKVLSTFTENARVANYIFNGINVAILGEPNAGKSSLFNKLLGIDRSIVTEIAGTTTDNVSETVQIDGYRIRFVDTAGIRDSANKIERLGVERSKSAARECDIALVFDKTALDIIGDKPHILVTKTSDPLDIKKQIILKTAGSPKIQSKSYANARQMNELTLAATALSAPAPTADCLASNIQTALYHLGKITGTNATEAVLNEIFSRFCLGK